MFVPSPNYNAVVPDLTPSSANLADNFNNQIQPILNRLEAGRQDLIAISQKQIQLQALFDAIQAAAIENKLTEVENKITALNVQNATVTNRLAAITATIDAIQTASNTLTSNANAIEANANARRLGVNVQTADADLTAIAAITPQPSTAIATNSTGDVVLVAIPNLGILPPSIYQGAWNVAIGGNSGYTTGQANIWIPIPTVQIFADSGFTTSGGRVSIAAGTYQLRSQICGVGCVEVASQILTWIGGTSTLIAEGTIARTSQSGGTIGQSHTVTSIVKDTVDIPNPCAIELQGRFKSPHSTAALSGGAPVSLISLAESFALISLIKIA